MTAQSNKLPWPLYLLIFGLGVLVLFMRNPDPIVNPVIYAEDGTWTAYGLREGWGNALLFSRTDYFVFLNVLLLFISKFLTTTLGEGTIENLPYAIAFVSYSFYSAFALLVFITIKRVSSIFFGTLGFLLILMLPLGNTQNEIIGRILQVGFVMPALALMLFFWRNRSRHRFGKLAIDIAIVIAAGTNPVVFVVSLLYFVRALFLTRFNFLSVLKSNLFLIVSLSVLALAIASRLSGHGGIAGDFVTHNLLEASIARSVLYPFVFPWYGMLSDLLSLFIFAAFVLVVYVAYCVSDKPETKKLMCAVAATLIAYTVLTILMRPGLTDLLDRYQTTFPDRYFMGINALATVLIVLSVAQLVSNHRTSVFGVLVGIVLVSTYALNYSAIFEWKESRMPIRQDFTFKDHVCLSDPVSDLNEILIYPYTPGLNMLVPKTYVSKDDCKFFSYEDLGAARPGSGHKMLATAPLQKGENIRLNIYKFPRERAVSRVEIMFGTHQRSHSGDAQLVMNSVGGDRVELDFSLADLLDNGYKGFDVPEDIYVSGWITSLTGEGVSTWESHGEDGTAFTCMRFIFADGGRGFTPGCPMFEPDDSGMGAGNVTEPDALPASPTDTG